MPLSLLFFHLRLSLRLRFTEQQKQQVRDAQMGRARLRRGAMLERLQERLSQGNEAKGKGKRKARLLNPKQLQILQEYKSGELRRQANKLTMNSRMIASHQTKEASDFLA